MVLILKKVMALCIQIIKFIIALRIIFEDLNDQTISILLLIIYLLLSLPNGLTMGSMVYGLIYLLFWLNHQCGFGDVLLIISICCGKTMIQCALINLFAGGIGLLILWLNHKKGKDPLPFAPALLCANWLLLFIEQFIN